MGMLINRRRTRGGKKGLPYGAVDMGLPSGTLWAQGNIVKDANGNYAIGEPTDYGCYYSWGNIDGHNEGDGYSFDQTNYNASAGASLTGNIPSDDALHDAAVARLGNGWHMANKNDWGELFSSNNTTRQWKEIDGIRGCLLTSVANGNTLFFPACGFCSGTSVLSAVSEGDYWSSSFYNDSRAYYTWFKTGRTYLNDNYLRIFGFAIRPIIII